jgi:hypothetical protein
MVWTALRSWLKGHEVQQSGRGRRTDRPRARGTRSFRPLLECLESRLAPAVSAVQHGATLEVNLSALKDHAVLSDVKEKASILVVGFDANDKQTFSQEFTGVKSINVHGAGGDLFQSVRLAGEVKLTGNLSVDRISQVLFSGASWRIAGNMNITTVGDVSSILASFGSLTVVGSTTLSSADNLDVEGANDFQGPVSLSAGSNHVRLEDASKLTLAKVSVSQDVTLAVGQLALTGNSHDYRSQNKGALFLQAASPTQTMTIGGDTAESYLSQDDIKRLGDSFGRLVIGSTSAASSNPITVQGMSYYTRTEIYTRDVITVNGTIETGSKTAGLRLDAVGGTVLNAGLRTHGGDVDVSANGPLTLGTPGTIEIRTTNGAKGGGAIRLGGVNDDDTPTVLRLAGGDVTFRGNVGNVKPVAGVEIATAHDVTFAGSTKAGSIKQEGGTGVTSLHDVVVTGSDQQPVALAITTSRVSLLGNVKAAGRTVEFHVSDGVAQGGSKGLTAAALALTGKGPFLLNGDHNDVATLAADVVGALSFHDLHDLTVGKVGGVSGIKTHSRDVTLNVVTLDVGGQLTVGKDIRVLYATITLKAGGGVVETADGTVVATGLRLEGLGTFDLLPGNLIVGTLFAEIQGDLYFNNNHSLDIGDGVAPTGISTGGGSVTITSKGSMTVKSEVNTGPGSGGGAIIDPKVILEANIVTGKGNITLDVTG